MSILRGTLVGANLSPAVANDATTEVPSIRTSTHSEDPGGGESIRAGPTQTGLAQDHPDACNVEAQDARTSATLARTEALRDECRRLRLQAVLRRRESVELRSACQRAGQECLLSIERSNASR
jgi:hypothetical protein